MLHLLGFEVGFCPHAECAWSLAHFVGNELAGLNSIGASVTAAQYAKNVIKLREIIDRLYNNSQQIPMIVAPGAFFDEKWYGKFLRKTGRGVVDVLTHHIYNMGAGLAPILTTILVMHFIYKSYYEY